MKLLVLLGLVAALSSCTIVNETLIIANGLATVKVINNKPKVRVSTGIDDCKWRGRIKLSDLSDGDHEIWIRCKIPFSM